MTAGHFVFVFLLSKGCHSSVFALYAFCSTPTPPFWIFVQDKKRKKKAAPQKGPLPEPCFPPDIFFSKLSPHYTHILFSEYNGMTSIDFVQACCARFSNNHVKKVHCIDIEISLQLFCVITKIKAYIMVPFPLSES